MKTSQYLIKFTKTSLIPIPPPMPPTLPANKHPNNTPITQEAVILQKQKLSPFNPFKHYDPLTKANIANMKKPFKSVTTNKPYEATITNETKANDLSNEELAQELLKRGLAKKDDGGTVCNILDKDNNSHALGTSDHGIKLTPLGQAYLKEAPTKNKAPLKDFVSENIPENIGEDITVGFAKVEMEGIFMKTGDQKHLLPLQPIPYGYASPEYMTSKSAASILATIQYRGHEREMEDQIHGTDSNIPKKWKDPQRSVPFDHLRLFKKDEIIEVKWSHTYIKNHIDIEALRTTWGLLWRQPQIRYNPNSGITKERALEMCQAYDFILYKKYNHPQTYDQQLAMEKK